MYNNIYVLPFLRLVRCYFFFLQLLPERCHSISRDTLFFVLIKILVGFSFHSTM